MNRADAHYLLTYLDERLLLAHSIFDFDTKKTGPDADQHMTDSLHRHFFRSCPCAKFIERKVWQLTEDYNFSILSSNGNDDLAEGEREPSGDDDAILADAAAIGPSIPAEDLEKRLKRKAEELDELAATVKRRREAAAAPHAPPAKA